MPLEDKLKKLKAEVEEKKEVEKKEAEEEKLAPIREEITDLQQKREKASGLVESLATEYEEAKKRLEEFKKKDAEVSSLFEKYKDALEEAGVETKEEFAARPEYAEEKEVEERKEARVVGREKVVDIAAIKEELKKEFPGQELSFVAKDREKAFETIQGEISKTDDQVEQLMIQTPEGREAVKKELTEKFSEVEEKKVLDYKVDSSDPEHIKVKLDRFYPVAGEDLEKSEKYGEDLVKDSIKEHYHNQVDKAYEYKKDKQGLNVAEKEVERMRGLSERSREVEEKLKDLAEKKRKALEEITQLRESDEDLDYAISGYGISSEEMLNLYHSSSHSPEEMLKNFSLLYESDLDSVVQGKELEVYDLENVISYTKRNDEFIDRVLDLVKKVSEEKDTNLKVNLFRETYGKDELSRSISDIPWIKFDSEALEYMKGKDSFREVGESLDKEIKELDNETQAIKERISAVIDIRWLDKEIGVRYRMGKAFSTIERDYESIQQNKENTAKALIDLASFKSRCTDKLEENVKVSGQSLEFSSVREELDKTRDSLKALDSEVESLKRQIREKEEKKPRLFGSKKKWEEELAELKGSLGGRESEKTRLGREHGEKEKKLYSEDFRNMFKHFGVAWHFKLEKQFEEILNQDKVKLSTFLDQLEGAFKEIQEKKLSPEDQEFYNKYKEKLAALESLEK